MNDNSSLCHKCQYCGKILVEPTEPVCILPHKIRSENVCYCICPDCRRKFVEISRVQRGRIRRET